MKRRNLSYDECAICGKKNNIRIYDCTLFERSDNWVICDDCISKIIVRLIKIKDFAPMVEQIAHALESTYREIDKLLKPFDTEVE